MRAYVDTSIILRIVFGEKNALNFPKDVSFYAANEILKIECFRSVERIRHDLSLNDDEIAERHAALYKIIRSLHIIKFNDFILQRACESFPITLKTLDAIHLSTAILWRQQEKKEILFLTHDVQLFKAARALGFEALGC